MIAREIAMLLMIDNYDSFTYNVVQYLGELGEDVHTYRNDAITIKEIESLDPDRIVISPGPCTPNEAGISVDLVKHFSGRKPILGICLGHQCIGEAFAGDVVRARKVMHGKISTIHHDESELFDSIENHFQATRYHSLVIKRDTLPQCLLEIAWTQLDDGSRDEIMAIRHQSEPVFGVQFHPESIKTDYGHDLLRNFLKAELH